MDLNVSINRHHRICAWLRRLLMLESAGVAEEAEPELGLRELARFRLEPAFSLPPSAHSCSNPAIE